MARLILEDVTLNRGHSLIITQVRFKGGATKVLRIELPARAWQLRKTKAAIVAEIDRLLEQCTDSEGVGFILRLIGTIQDKWLICSI